MAPWAMVKVGIIASRMAAWILDRHHAGCHRPDADEEEQIAEIDRKGLQKSRPKPSPPDIEGAEQARPQVDQPPTSTTVSFLGCSNR